jgi:hypothetical protein
VPVVHFWCYKVCRILPQRDIVSAYTTLKPLPPLQGKATPASNNTSFKCGGCGKVNAVTWRKTRPVSKRVFLMQGNYLFPLEPRRLKENISIRLNVSKNYQNSIPPLDVVVTFSVLKDDNLRSTEVFNFSHFINFGKLERFNCKTA